VGDNAFNRNRRSVNHCCRGNPKEK
jgi:hypothetical protein